MFLNLQLQIITKFDSLEDRNDFSSSDKFDSRNSRLEIFKFNHKLSTFFKLNHVRVLFFTKHSRLSVCFFISRRKVHFLTAKPFVMQITINIQRFLKQKKNHFVKTGKTFSFLN